MLIDSRGGKPIIAIVLLRYLTQIPMKWVNDRIHYTSTQLFELRLFFP